MSGLRWRRKNGLQSPLNAEQVLVLVSFFALTVFGLVVIGLGIESAVVQAVLFTVYGLLALVTISLWLYIELTDPAELGRGTIPCVCMRETQDAPARWCSHCGKATHGLDHHCVWLNTDIGTRNYFQFFTMSVTGTVQMVLQVVFSILACTIWIPAEMEGSIGFYVLVGLQALGAAVAAGSLISLVGFHVYLLFLGMGTYDWLMKKYVERDERERAAAEREREAHLERQKQARLARERQLELELAAHRPAESASGPVRPAPTRARPGSGGGDIALAVAGGVESHLGALPGVVGAMSDDSYDSDGHEPRTTSESAAARARGPSDSLANISPRVSGAFVRTGPSAAEDGSSAAHEAGGDTPGEGKSAAEEEEAEEEDGAVAAEEEEEDGAAAAEAEEDGAAAAEAEEDGAAAAEAEAEAAEEEEDGAAAAEEGGEAEEKDGPAAAEEGGAVGDDEEGGASTADADAADAGDAGSSTPSNSNDTSGSPAADGAMAGGEDGESAGGEDGGEGEGEGKSAEE